MCWQSFVFCFNILEELFGTKIKRNYNTNTIYNTYTHHGEGLSRRILYASRHTQKTCNSNTSERVGGYTHMYMRIHVLRRYIL